MMICWRALVFFILLGVAMLQGVLLFHSFPYAVAMAFVSPPIYRWVVDSLIGYFFVFVAALMEQLLGIKVVISGDEILPGERSLIMMNHRTCLDWMYFWSVLVRMGGPFKEKIIIKADPKRLPGAGWAMQCGAFVFLERKWEADQVTLTEMLDYFTNLKHKTQLLLFPEGTDFCPRTKARSDAFAEKNSLPCYDYVLHPRTTGFTFLSTEMHQRNMLDAIYDVSIAYPKEFPCKEWQLLNGLIPPEVHFRIKRHPVDEVDTTKEGLEMWCRCRWAEKEEQLKTFYEETRSFTGPLLTSEAREAPTRIVLRLAILFWALFVLGWSVVLWYSWLARIFVVCQVVFFLVMDRLGGWEMVQARYTNRMYGPRQKDD